MARVESIRLLRIEDFGGIINVAMAPTLAAYMASVQERDRTTGKHKLVGCPLSVDDVNSFLAPQHLITPDDTNLITWLRQACVVCGTALSPCSCKRYQKVHNDSGTTTWEFKNGNDAFDVFIQPISSQLYRWNVENLIRYVLLPQYVLAFLELFPDVKERYGNLRGQFDCSIFYVSTAAPPSLDTMRKLYQYQDNLRSCHAERMRDDESFDKYTASSVNMQRFLMEIAGVLKSQEDDEELALLRKQILHMTGEGNGEAPEEERELKATKYGRGKKRLASDMDKAGPIARLPNKMNGLLAVLVNPAAACCRGKSAPPLVISKSQASTLHHWRRTPAMTELLDAMVPQHGHRSILRMQLRSKVVELPLALSTKAEARRWLLQQIEQNDYLNIIARWCTKKRYGRLLADKVREIWEALHANLTSDRCLPRRLSALLPGGVLLECIPNIYVQVSTGDPAGFSRAPIVSDQITGPLLEDACHPETQTIGLPVLLARLHGADYDGDNGTLRIPEFEFLAAQMTACSSYKELRWDAAGRPNLGLPGWAKHAVSTLMEEGHKAGCTYDITGGAVYWRGGRELRFKKSIVAEALGSSGHGHAWLTTALEPLDIKEVRVHCPLGAPALSYDGWFPIPALESDAAEWAYLEAVLRGHNWTPQQLKETRIVAKRWSPTLNMISGRTWQQYTILSLAANDVDACNAPPPPAARAEGLVDESDSEEEGDPIEANGMEETDEEEAAAPARAPAPRTAWLPRLPDHPEGVLDRRMYRSSKPDESLTLGEKSWLRFATALRDLFHLRAGLHHFICLQCEEARNHICSNCLTPQQGGDKCRRCAGLYLHPPPIESKVMARRCSRCNEEEAGRSHRKAKCSKAECPGIYIRPTAAEGELRCSSCSSHDVEERARPLPYRRLRICWAAEGIPAAQRKKEAEAVIAAAIRRCTWRPKAEECRWVCAWALHDRVVEKHLLQLDSNLMLHLEEDDFMKHLAPLAAHFAASGAALAADVLRRHCHGNAPLQPEPADSTLRDLMEHYGLLRLGRFEFDGEMGQLRWRGGELSEGREVDKPEAMLEELLTTVQQQLRVPHVEDRSQAPMPLWQLRLCRPTTALDKWRELVERMGFMRCPEERRRQQNWRRVVRALCYEQRPRLTVAAVTNCCEAQLGAEAATAVEHAFFQMGSTLALFIGSGIDINDISPLDDTPLHMLALACNAIINAHRAKAADCDELDYQNDVRLFLIKNVEKTLRLGTQGHLFGHDIGPVVALLASYASTDIPGDAVHLKLPSTGATVVFRVTAKTAELPFRSYSSEDEDLQLVARELGASTKPCLCSRTGRYRPAEWRLMSTAQEWTIAPAAAWMPPSSATCKAGPDSRLAGRLNWLRSLEGRLRHRNLPHVLEAAMPFLTRGEAGVGAKTAARVFTIAPCVANSFLERATREVGLMGNEISDASMANLNSTATQETAAYKAAEQLRKQKGGVSLIAQCRRTAVESTNAIRLQGGHLYLAPFVDGICRRPLEADKPHGEICGERLQRLAGEAWRCRKHGRVDAPPAVSLRVAETGMALGLARSARALEDWRLPPRKQTLKLLRGQTLWELSDEVTAKGQVMTVVPLGYEICEDVNVAATCRADLKVYVQQGCALRCARAENEPRRRCLAEKLTATAERCWLLLEGEVILVRQVYYTREGAERMHVPDESPDALLESLLAKLARLEPTGAAGPARAAEEKNAGEEPKVEEASYIDDDMKSSTDEASSDGEEPMAALEGVAFAEVWDEAEDKGEGDEAMDDGEQDEALAHMLAAIPTEEATHSAGKQGEDLLVYAPDVPLPDFAYTFNGYAAAPPVQGIHYGSSATCKCKTCGEPSVYRLLKGASPFRRPTLLLGADVRRSLSTLCDNCMVAREAQELDHEKQLAKDLAPLGTHGTTLHSARAALAYYSIFAELREHGVPLKLPDPKLGSKLLDIPASTDLSFQDANNKRRAVAAATSHLFYYMESSMAPWEVAALIGRLRRGEPLPPPSSVLTKHFTHPIMQALQATGPARSLKSTIGPGPRALRRKCGKKAFVSMLTSKEAHILVDNRNAVVWGNSLRKRQPEDPPGWKHFTVQGKRRPPPSSLELQENQSEKDEEQYERRGGEESSSDASSEGGSSSIIDDGEVGSGSSESDDGLSDV